MQKTNTQTTEKLNINDFATNFNGDDQKNEIIQSLFAENKSIPSKYFYDAKGSELFEKITKLSEYYPSKTEKKILREFSGDILDVTSPKAIVELGSGDPSKIDIFLNKLKSLKNSRFKYIPVDISGEAIRESCNYLTNKYPFTEIEGYILDFTNQLHLINENNNKLFCFLGGTIGNLSRNYAVEFSQSIKKQMSEGDYFILGVDRVKEKSVLESAYNDSKRITEQFNLNILNNVNRILISDFNTDDFNHHAFFNEEKERIEMHLIAKRNITVNSPLFNNPLTIRKDESIHTEISNKFSEKRIYDLADKSGFNISKIYSDEKNYFSLLLLKPLK